jgi:hypothetical protein
MSSAVAVRKVSGGSREAGSAGSSDASFCPLVSATCKASLERAAGTRMCMSEHGNNDRCRSAEVENVLSRVGVTIDGVWIGESIY